MYEGDYTPGKTVVFDFNTAAFADGSPITLGGTPALSVYKNSTTESTAGVTLTVDYDSRTGLQHVVIDTSADGSFYAAGNDFSVIITTGTVGGTSVVGRKVGSFSLSNRSALRPATADRMLVVDAAGLADANAVKVGPSGSGTAQTAGDIPARLPAALTAGGNMKADALAFNGVSTSPVTTVKAVQGLTTADTIASYTGNTPQTGDAFARLGAPAGASVSADIAAAKGDTASIKTQTDKLAFTVANQVDANVLDWKSSAAPAMTGDAFARLGAPAGASISADLAAVKTDTGNLVTRITSTLFTGITSLAKWLGLLAGKTADAGTLAEMQATTAGAGYTNVTDSQEALRDRGDAAWTTGGGGGGSSSGARTVAITIDDGANPLQGARVRLTLNDTSWVQSTDASGQTTFNLDDGTWIVAISLAGYSFPGDSLLVAADGEQTYSMTAVVFVPSDPGLSTGYLTCYDSAGAAEPGASLQCKASALDSSVAGVSLDSAVRTLVSDAQGLVQFTNLFKGATYGFRRGTAGKWRYAKIPLTAGDNYALPAAIGQP